MELIIQMSGQIIAPSKHNRYLGVEIDNELNWNYHLFKDRGQAWTYKISEKHIKNCNGWRD